MTNPRDLPALRILPGLDGTTRMLDGFIAQARAAGFDDAEAIGYPVDRALDADGLEAFARERLPDDKPFLLLGESFSGPIALRIAADPPPTLRALVLSTTFATTPVPLLSPFAPLTRIAPVLTPMPLLSWLLLGRWRTPALRTALRQALDEVSPDVLRSRAALALRIDARDALSRIRVPTLYLRANHDRLMHPSAGDTILRGITGARLHALDGPHLLLQTRGDACTEAIAAFVRDAGL
ncbi:MAG: alpha/beta hydrolase [Lysobacter sp.]|nr:alpha/beta hydrolase [Lysobacter sp.]